MRRAIFCLLIALSALVAAGCGGGGGGDGSELVRQTFGNAQKVKSGKVQVALNVKTEGLTGLDGPIQVRFGGPFQRQDKGAPRYAFTLSAGAAGQSITAGAVSTGRQGFVSVQKTNYILPADQYARLNRSYEQVTGVAQPKTTKSGDIPWITDPKIVGDDTTAGAETTHVTAGIDVGKLLDGLDQRQGRAPPLTDAQRQQVVDAVKTGKFDFWTGRDDHVLRRVRLRFGVNVPESARARVGGLRSLDISLDNQLSDLNEPQTISALPNPQPLTALTARVQGLLGQLQALQGGLGGSGGSGGGLGGSGGSGGSPAPGAGGGASSKQANRYFQCLQQAGGNVAAQQKCAGLLK